MSMDKDLQKVSELYYNQRMTQSQIASKLNKSQSTISRYLRMLSHRGEKGFLRLDESESHKKEIEKQLCGKYKNLKTAKVFEFPELEEATSIFFFRELGEQAAWYIDSILKPDRHIVVSGGRSIFYTVQALQEKRLRVTIDPLMLIRGMGLEEGKIPAWVNSTLMGAKYWMDQTWDQIIPQYLDDMDGENLANKIAEMKEKPPIKEAIDRISDPDIVLLSAGPLHKQSAFVKLAEKLNIHYYELEKLGVLGNICHTLIDGDGEPVRKNNLDQMAITIPLDRLSALSKDRDRDVLLIAGGIHKYEIIKTAIEAQYCNILVTDEGTAEWLIEAKREENI